MNARMGARPWLAHTQHDYARMLLARARTATAHRARELLDEARFTYCELGMDPQSLTISAAAHPAPHAP